MQQIAVPAGQSGTRSCHRRLDAIGSLQKPEHGDGNEPDGPRDHHHIADTLASPLLLPHRSSAARS
jgi:hypothetical protein